MPARSHLQEVAFGIVLGILQFVLSPASAAVLNGPPVTVEVSSLEELKRALDAATLGSVIRLAASIHQIYAGDPQGVQGLPDQPIVIQAAPIREDGRRSTMIYGERTTLSWNVSGATSLTLNGVNVTGSTSTVVAPSVTTTYSLIATNSVGSVSSSVTVNVTSGAMSYSINFPLTENPISEGGNWISGVSSNWAAVSTTPGKAIGHQIGPSYSDGTAVLSGSWNPNQTVQATVFSTLQQSLNNNPYRSCYPEVELRLRSTLTATSSTGYEVFFSVSPTSGAYAAIARWNGPFGDFTMLGYAGGLQYGVKNGDVVKATISGNVITVYKNGTLLLSASDNMFTSGSPGMGFNLENGSKTNSACYHINDRYGYTQYSAVGN